MIVETATLFSFSTFILIGDYSLGNPKQITELPAKNDILATLAYFDIFNYPITQTEIFLFLRNTYSNIEFTEAIQNLITDNWVYKFDEFYTLRNDYDLVLRRRKGNIAAKKLIDIAEKIAGFLSNFPFVRGIAVSGSLSKNFADENSDIDLFIITTKNKLWLARTFMHLFKKLSFLVNKQHLFCMNYFIAENMLQIREKNIYTATEVATLLPLRGIKAFKDFYSQNNWSKEYLPNHTMRISYVQEMHHSIFKRIFEFFLNNPVGDLLDFLFMKITSKRWQQKTKRKKLNSHGVIMGMDAARHYAKPDPKNFQKTLIDLYDKKVLSINKKIEKMFKPVY